MSFSTFERFKNRISSTGAQSGQNGDNSQSEAPGTPVAASSTPSILAVAAQPTKILQDLLDCVQSLKTGFDEDGTPVDDNNQTLHRFCAKLEFLLQTDMKDKKSITGRKKDYWEYFCECLAPLKGVNDGIKYVKTTGDCKTSLGKGRSFLRFCLMHQRLADSLQACCTNGKVTSGWYHPKSIWLQHDKSSMIISALYDLNDIIFDLAPRGYDLDNSWPSFARKNLDGQHTWSLTERARTMSISSLNSIGQDTPVKGQFSSTPNDTSGMDHLAQELAISENVRSDLEDRMEALEQQKQIFQQTVAESKGEVNMLESQLRELQTEHKELQATYRELEKKYDKMCLETEYKDRDGKTQEYAFETKISELRTENEKLHDKITQVEEDLELSQENLQITSAERDAAQKVVEELKEKVNTLEVNLGEIKEKTEEVKNEMEAEKQELLQKLKAVEEVEDTRQRDLSDMQTEFKEQTSLVVSLEKKVSALTTGYQWLNKLREGSSFTEIPDLDATSSLTLKDMSYFVTGLQDKITTICQEKQSLNEQYQSLFTKHSALQQEASLSRDKLINLESSLANLQESEKALKKKVEEFQGVAMSDKHNLKQIHEDIDKKEKEILDLKNSVAAMEQERLLTAKELNQKNSDLLDVKKEIEMNKEELNRANEMTSMAVKNSQESLEKVKALEQDIKDRDVRIDKLLQQEKELELSMKSIEKQEELQCERLSDKDKEIQKLTEEVKKHSDLNESFKQRLDEFRSEKDLSGLELRNSKEKVSHFENRIKDLEEQIIEEKQRYEAVYQNLERIKLEATNKQAELRNEKDTLSRELESTKNVNIFSEREIKVLKEKLENQESTISKLHESENKLLTKLENVEKELSLKSLSLVSFEKDNDMKGKESIQLKNENKMLKSEVKMLQDQTYERQSEVMLLQEKVQRSHDELERTKQFYETATKSESEWSDRFKTLESSLSAKDAKILELTEREKSLTVENSKICRDKTDLEQNLEKLQSDLDYLKKGFKGKESQIEKLRAITGDANVEKESLKRSVDDISNQLEERKSEISSLQLEIENLDSEKSSIEKSLKELHLKELNASKENRQLEQNIFDMEQKRKELVSTIEQMQKDFEEAVKEKESLEERVSSLEEESKSNETQIEELSFEMDQLKSEKEKIHETCLDKDKQLNEERERYQKLQLELDVLAKDKYQLEENVESLEKEIQEDTKELDEQRIIIGNLEKEKKDLKEKIRQLEESDMNNRNEIDSLRSKQGELEKNGEALTEKMNEEISEKLELQSSMKIMESEVNELQIQLKARKSEIDELTVSVQEKNAILDRLELEKVDIEKNFQKISDDVLVLQEKESNNVDAIKKLEESIQKSELEKEGIQGNLSLKCVEMNELQARFDDFQSENACLVQEYDLLQQTFNDLKETEEVVRSKLTEMTTCRDQMSAKLEQVNEQLQTSELQLQEIAKEKDTLVKEKESLSNELDELRCRCSETESKLSDLEIQQTDTCSVKNQLEVKLKEIVDENERKSSDIDSLQKQLMETKENLSKKDNEIEINEKNRNDSEIKCNALEEDVKKLHIDLENKELEIENLKDLLTSNECTANKLKQNMMELETQGTELKNDLLEAKKMSSEYEILLDEKSKVVNELEHKFTDLKEVIVELEADKKQLIIDLKTQQQEKDTLQNKDAGNSDIILELRREVSEVKHTKNAEIQKLENEIDKLRQTEASLHETIVLSKQEMSNLTGKIEALELSNCDMQKTREKVSDELVHMTRAKDGLEEKCSRFENELHDLRGKLRHLELDKETCEKDLRQATTELEMKKNDLVKNLEDAVSDLQVIKEQLSSTSSELETAHEEKVCLEKSLHEANAKTNDLEQKVESLNDQLLLVTDDLGCQLKKKDSKINELESIKNSFESETSAQLLKLQKEKTEAEEKFQQILEELDLLKRSIEDKEKHMTTSDYELQRNNEEMECTKKQNEALFVEISQFKEMLTAKDEVIENKTELIDVLRNEKASLTDKLQGLESSNIENDDSISKLNKQVKELSSKVDELSKENDVYKEEQQNLLEKEADLNARLTELTNKNKDFEEKCVTLQSENESIRSNIDQEKEELKKMEEMLQETESKLESIERENERKAQESESEVDSLRQEIAALEFQLSANQLEAEKTQKSGLDEREFSEMKDKVMEQDAIIDQLQREMVELREVAANYKEQEIKMDRLNAEIINKDLENSSLSEKLEDLQQELREQMNSSLSVKNTYDDQKVKTEELLHQKDKEINQLKEDASELKKKLVKLIRDKDALWQKTDRLSFQQKLQASEKWMDDGKVTHCLGCNAEFSFTLRKHHCRLCGRIFCHTCSDYWVHTASSSKKSRACTACFVRFNEALKGDSNQETHSDIEQSVEIPKRQVLGSPLPSSASFVSSTMSDSDSVLESDTSPISQQAVYDTVPGNDPVTQLEPQLGATGGNETDEDKLKDSAVGAKSLLSDERGDNGEDKFHMISDEEIQRSLSISQSGDQTAPAQLDPYMSSSLCISLVDLVRGEVNSQNEVWIKAGRSFAVPVLIDKPNTVFGWEFTSYPKDVVFSATYRSSQVIPFSDGQTLVPPCKCDSHKQVVKGELTAKQPGIYTLLFDNTYSKLTSKRVNYTLLSDPPEDD